MLNVEEPNASGRGDECDWKLNRDKHPKAHRFDEDEARRQDRGICRHRTEPGPPSLPHRQRNAVLKEKKKGRPEDKEDEWASVDPIAKAPPPALHRVFPNRQRSDVTDAAASKIADARVMAGMG